MTNTCHHVEAPPLIMTCVNSEKPCFQPRPIELRNSHVSKKGNMGRARAPLGNAPLRLMMSHDRWGFRVDYSIIDVLRKQAEPHSHIIGLSLIINNLTIQHEIRINSYMFSCPCRVSHNQLRAFENFTRIIQHHHL